MVFGLLGGMALFMMLGAVAQAVGLSSVKVFSTNMEPTLEAGAMAVVRRVDTEKLGIGDVIVYRSSTDLITQRIVGVVRGDSARVFVLKGDADTTADSNRVLDTEVVGQIAFSVPQIGFLVDFGRSIAGVVVEMMTLAAILLLIWARTWGRERVRFSQQPARLLVGRIQ